MYSNGINHHDDVKLLQSKFNKLSLRKIPRQIQINERTFSLLLFTVSLAIVIGKLFFIYGDDIPSTLDENLSLMNIKKNLGNVYNIPSVLKMTKPHHNNLSFNETLFNSRQFDEYKKVISHTTSKIFDRFWWLIKASLSGLGILAFTWFIIYKDSNIPGVNPPSPFSPTKKKLSDNSTIQMNYLIGIINGILIFIYMSIQSVQS